MDGFGSGATLWHYVAHAQIFVRRIMARHNLRRQWNSARGSSLLIPEQADRDTELEVPEIIPPETKRKRKI